uniref:Uncharacterized protein n=1 Tax=Romanomermis culicivorax TaxID=13658 RepID=A0A915HNI1_ROMCU
MILSISSALDTVTEKKEEDLNSTIPVCPDYWHYWSLKKLKETFALAVCFDCNITASNKILYII